MAEPMAPDANDERYAPLYGAALEWSNVRVEAQAAYRFFQHEATRTAARQMVTALNAIEDQKWIAVLEAACNIAAADAGKPSKEEFGKALDVLIASGESYGYSFGTDVPGLKRKREAVDAARREVERLAGYGEG